MRKMVELQQRDRKTPLSNYYLQSFHKSRDRIVLPFREAENCLRPDLLKKALEGICGSLRDYHLVQDHFVTSHSAICASHYLLGIGDRHQSNFMVEVGSGGVVGIDFGHAFGSATQFLPIPELMPFRLTRQFLGVMGPVGPGGRFSAGLRESLRALRLSAHLLLAAMEVFVREPSLDWLMNAKRQMGLGKMSEPDGEDPSSWFPKEKIRIAADKLQGANPILLLRDELNGSRHARHADAMTAAALGEEAAALGPDCLARPRGFPPHHLTPAQQAHCLIPPLEARIFKNLMDFKKWGWSL